MQWSGSRALAILVFFVSFQSAAGWAASELDWMREQPDDELGLEVPDREFQPLAADRDREDFVNFILTGEVSRIDDGDTIDLRGKDGARFVIRFSDMDTPEVSHEEMPNSVCPCAGLAFRPGQPGGKAATQSLMELVAVGDLVTAECYEIEKYGRPVCHVFKDGQNIILEQISRGWGWLPSKKEWIRDPASVVAEQEAKSKKLGAWGLPGQISPAEWRDLCWKKGQCDNAEN